MSISFSCEGESFGSRHKMVVEYGQVPRGGKLLTGGQLFGAQTGAFRIEQHPDWAGIVKQLVQLHCQVVLILRHF